MTTGWGGRLENISAELPGRTHRGILFVAALSAFTLFTRILCHGTVYFADGPQHVHAIVEKYYVIQAPGYWLFNHIAGLFPDPAFGIAVMNVAFSVAGVVVFYYTATLMTGEVNAFVAGLAYATIFYAWFSGEIHSTYASQLLFPVLLFYLMLRFERDHAQWVLWLAAVVYAIGAGLRPSDGFFLIPMAIYWAVTRLTRKEMAGFFALWGFLCLGWLVPTLVIFHHDPDGLAGQGSYMREMLTVLSVFSGIHAKSLANVARYLVPLVAAMWPFLFFALRNAMRNRGDWRISAMTLWVIPGSLFFGLVMITDPVYLNFLTAALLLTAVNARRAMAVTAIWNAVLFCLMAPVQSRSVVVDVLDCYVLEYTCFGVQHHTALRLPDLLRAK